MARKRYYGTRTEFWLGNLKERDHFEDTGADIRVTSNEDEISSRGEGGLWIGKRGRLLRTGNEPQDSIKCGETTDNLQTMLHVVRLF